MKRAFAFLFLLMCGFIINAQVEQQQKFDKNNPYLIIENIASIDNQKELITKYLPDTIVKEMIFSDFYRTIFSYDNNTELPTQTISQTSSDNILWTNDRLDIYTFNQNNKIISQIVKYWEDSLWNDYFKSSYEYNANGNIISFKLESIENGNWINNSLKSYYYDEKENETTYIEMFWNENKWDTIRVFISTYDTNNNKISYTTKINNSLDNFRRIFYEYDNNRNLIQYIEQRYTIDWDNYRKTDYTYNEQNLKILEIGTAWQDSVWTNVRKYEYLYNEKGLETTLIRQTWNNEQWSNVDSKEYLYNTNNNKILSTEYLWEETTSIPYTRIAYNYENNNCIEALKEDFDNNIWIKSTADDDLVINYNNNKNSISIYGIYAKISYIQKQVEGIKDIKNKRNNSILIYPNPTNDILNIETSNNNNSFVEIYNSIGKLMISKKANNLKGNKIDVSTLQPGLYFIKIDNAIEKFIKE